MAFIFCFFFTYPKLLVGDPPWKILLVITCPITLALQIHMQVWCLHALWTQTQALSIDCVWSQSRTYDMLNCYILSLYGAQCSYN